MSLEELEKIAELETRLKQRLIIPLSELKPVSFSSIVLVLDAFQDLAESVVGVVSFLAKKHKCKVKLVCHHQTETECGKVLSAFREKLREKNVGDVEEYVSTDDVASFISMITEGKLSLIVMPSPKSMEDSFKLIESFSQKLGFPMLIVERSSLAPERILGNVMVLVREPDDIKDPLPVLISVCAEEASMTFLTYIGDYFLSSLDFLCSVLSEMSHMEKEKLVASACNMMEKAIKEVKPSLIAQGFKVNHIIEAGIVDEASINLMKKIGAHLIAIPVKMKLRPETKLVLLETASFSSFLLIPKCPPESPAVPPKKS
ncbi:MAG: hypothetical protein QXX87_06125 [Candidatus Jordarchaeales archaeon]